MSSSRLCSLLAVSGLLTLFFTDLATAQIVRRFARGEIQIQAPFVRVNVGPGGATSVRAPFVAVDSLGRTSLGRRLRLMAQPQYAAPPQNVARSAQANPLQPTPPQPEIADVDALSYPTVRELAAMEDAKLVETLRQMMARFHYRLSRLKTGEGWQKYLVLRRETLGSPGAPPAAAQMDAVQKVLPRYRSVQDDPQFAKIAALPSFFATFAALQEADRRFGDSASSGPEIVDPYKSRQTSPAEPSEKELNEEGFLEILPTPPTDIVPNATRGERSILKR